MARGIILERLVLERNPLSEILAERGSRAGSRSIQQGSSGTADGADTDLQVVGGKLHFFALAASRLDRVIQLCVEAVIGGHLRDAFATDRHTLLGLIKGMGIRVRELLRRRGSPYDELGLYDPKWTDEQLIDTMIAHPILINRPIVVTPLGVKLSI